MKGMRLGRRDASLTGSCLPLRLPPFFRTKTGFTAHTPCSVEQLTLAFHAGCQSSARSTRSWGSVRGLSQFVDHLARSQRKKQATNTAEQHANPHQCPDHPFAVRWPRPPDQDGEDQSNDPI
jgi:hypothetical protein